MTILCILMIFVLILGVREIRKDREQIKAIFLDCDTAEELIRWRMANPDLYIGDVPQAGEIVLRRIAAYRRLLETHSYIKDNGHLKFLESLLSEREPPPPWDNHDPAPNPVLQSRA